MEHIQQQTQEYKLYVNRTIFIYQLLLEKLRQQSVVDKHKYYAKILKYVHISFHETLILKQNISQQTNIEIEIRLYNICKFLMK